MKSAGIRSGFGDEWIRFGAVKYWADGSASERTMRMSTPYEGRPGDFGILTMEQSEIDAAVDEALKAGDQKRSCALVERYGKTIGDVEPLMAQLIQPALMHNGALHHEKYFHTATEEYARSGKEYRWDHLVALTRVMASGYGFPSAGFEVAKNVLEAQKPV